MEQERLSLETEWKDVLARVKRAVLARCYQPANRVKEFVDWSVDVESGYRAARVHPYYFERITANHDVFLISRILSSMPRKAAYKYIRSLTVGKEPVSKEVSETIEEIHSWIAVFGHSLIESGKEALPVDCLIDASRYKRSTDVHERRQILERVMNRLMCGQWEKKHPLLAEHDRSDHDEHDGDHVTFPYDPWMVLPYVFGRYPDSPMRPNCMGMSILMSAWCRVADVNFMHCRLLEHHTTYHWFHYAAALERTLAFCDLHGIAIDSQTRSWMQNDLETARGTMKDTVSGPLSEGHAFVCAEVEPGIWMALDPWMESMFELDESWTDDSGTPQFSLGPNEAYRILREQHLINPGVTLTGYNHQWDEIEAQVSYVLDEQLLLARSKQRLIELFIREDHSFEQLIGVLTLNLATSRLPEGYLDRAMTQLLVRRFDAEMPDVKQLILAASTQILSELHMRYRAVHGGDALTIDRMCMRVNRDYRRDQALAERVRTDLVTAAVIPVLDFYADKLRTRDKDTLNREPYIGIEYGISTIHIGLGALVHLMAWDEEMPELMQPTDLLRLTSSQLVWQEVVTSLHHRYEKSRWNHAVFAQDKAEWVKSDPDNDGIEEVDHLEIDRPLFGELVLTDRHDWESLLGSSGIEWLTPSELGLIRETTRSIMLLEPYRQHRQVRRLLDRLIQENEWAQQFTMSPNNQEVTHGEENIR